MVGRLTVLLRPDNKMPTIGQETIRRDTYWLPLVCIDHDALKHLKVVLLPEQLHLPGPRSGGDKQGRQGLLSLF
jgi:hypothetical protein